MQSRFNEIASLCNVGRYIKANCLAHNDLKGEEGPSHFPEEVSLTSSSIMGFFSLPAHIVGEAHWSAVYTEHGSPVVPSNNMGSKISPIT